MRVLILVIILILFKFNILSFALFQTTDFFAAVCMRCYYPAPAASIKFMLVILYNLQPFYFLVCVTLAFIGTVM